MVITKSLRIKFGPASRVTLHAVLVQATLLAAYPARTTPRFCKTDATQSVRSTITKSILAVK